MLILILLAAYGRLARRLYDRIITTPTFKINRIRMDFYCRPISTGVSKHVNSYVNSKKRKDGEEYSRVPFQQTSVRYTIGKCLYRSVGTGPPMDMGDGEMLVLRPMNCPHHMMVYKNDIRNVCPLSSRALILYIPDY